MKLHKNVKINIKHNNPEALKMFMPFNKYRNPPQTQRTRNSTKIRLLSLKIWLPLFFIITALLYIMADYYLTLNDAMPYFVKIMIYLFGATINIPIGYYILNKTSHINPQTNKNRYSLTIITVLIAITGFITAGYALMSYYLFKINPVFGYFLNKMLLHEFLYIFGTSLSTTLGLIGTYLAFKFQNKHETTTVTNGG